MNRSLLSVFHHAQCPCRQRGSAERESPIARVEWVCKEPSRHTQQAVLSSQIEGTQSSLSDLLLYENDEAPGVPIEEVQEVSNYVTAMNHGLERMLSGFSLSLRLIREIHEILLSKGRGSGKRPGEFRRSQNWIGGSRPGNAVFVPPPPELLNECLSQFDIPT